MKELLIEEKAKRYDEAIERAKIWYYAPNADKIPTYANRIVSDIFPELKGAEDEKIRREIISFVRGMLACHDKPNAERDEKYESWIAYLEKKSEPVEINPTEFDTRLQALIGKFKGLPKEELIGSLSFWLNVVQNDGTYREEKQGEQKPAKNIVETWKDMRLEVYQQASGNRHEPNCSDDTTKMFSLNDIDEIVEKMSEQSHTDKAEPKFHESEWLCENEPNNYARFIQILETVNVQGKERYRISRDIHNDEDIVEFDFVEKYYHKFDIKDAKDGDVLATPDYILIFKQHLEDNGWVSYCYYAFTDSTPCFNWSEDRNWYFGKEAIIHPATKEEIDLLFDKMREAGYEWDAEKKELTKIYEEVNGEDYGIDSLYHAQRILEKTLGSVEGYQSDDGILVHKAAISTGKKLYELKPVEWSEEDEKMVENIIDTINMSIEDCDVDDIGTKARFSLEKERDWLKNRLKSISPQKHWKPSDEQLKSLKEVIDTGHYTSYPNALETLYEQIKKLKDE